MKIDENLGSEQRATKVYIHKLEKCISEDIRKNVTVMRIRNSKNVAVLIILKIAPKLTQNNDRTLPKKVAAKAIARTLPEMSQGR